ncbi:hypothetical protein BKA65DRAFT_485199 [Rhexocercosporidium sp. MPI-PUGE-AT-0058]|nr:hypothetical protein BKA65DRAFT_485199 [Rhexocercosporidium sp. MPI-PUGE-AT-0058]
MVLLTIKHGLPVMEPPVETTRLCVNPRVTHRIPDVKFEIPPEIMIMIARHLPKSDWKSLRLVSHQFLDFCLDLPLHTEVWFSPYAEDLEVFMGICREPGLAKHITSVIIDTTAFGGYGGLNIERTMPRGIGRFDPSTGNLNITQTWIEANGLDPESDDVMAFKRHMQESYAFEHCQKELLSKFMAGIKFLPKVRSFRLHCAFDQWENGHFRHLSGQSGLASPLARSWPNKHYLSPFVEGGWFHSSNIRARYFDFALTAIVESKGKLDCLDISPTPNPLNALRNLHNQSFHVGKVAFAALASLKLSTNFYAISDMVSEHGFVHLFTAARSLKKLDLSISLCHGLLSPPSYSIADDIVAKLFGTRTMENLTEMRLANSVTTTKTLCEMLERHRKTLKRIHLEKITIIDDNKNWVSELLDFCKKSLILDAVRIEYLLRDPTRNNRRIQVNDNDKIEGWGE